MPNSPMHYAFTASQEQFIYQRGRGIGIWIGIGMGIDRDAAREWNGMECPPQVPPYEPSKNHAKLRRQRATKSIRDQSQKTQRNKGLSMRDERWRSFHVDFGLWVRVGWGMTLISMRARALRSQLAATRSMCVSVCLHARFWRRWKSYLELDDGRTAAGPIFSLEMTAKRSDLGCFTRLSLTPAPW
jgi:hypothetical protein